MLKSIIPVKFFATKSGNEPVREWLKSLSHDEKKNIGEDIKTVQIGWPLGMPLVKNLSDDLHEIRSSLPSKKISRIIFFMHKGEIILLHGFIKKTQKIEVSDLRLANKRKNEVINYE